VGNAEGNAEGCKMVTIHVRWEYKPAFDCLIS